MNAIGDQGQVKRSYYQRRLPENPTKDYYYIMRETGNISPLLIEYGFIDNYKDINKLQNNLLNYVEAVVKAVTEYTGYTYVKPDEEIDGYIVKKGDTLYSIANKYGISVDDLKKYNNINNNILQIGQIIKIPVNDDKPIKNYINYTVKKGDTLFKIANEFNTTIKDIIEINDLESTILNIGQIIKVPSNNTNPDNIYYTVVKGDSLYKIAKMYNVNVDDIIKLNNLNNNILQIGDILIIPKKEDNSTPPVEGVLKYTVVNGDTLYKIANMYNVDVDSIKKLNNLESNLLSVNQVLLIPNKNSVDQSYIEYVVIPGDTLYRIAMNFNTSVNTIKNLNNLISNTLQVNQVLKIPKN